MLSTNSIQCTVNSHLKCHHSCSASGVGASTFRSTMDHKNTPSMFLSGVIIRGITWDNDAIRDKNRQEDVAVKNTVKYNRLMHLSCHLSQACFVKSSFPILAFTQTDSTCTCKVMQGDTARVTSLAPHYVSTRCDPMDPQPPLHIFEQQLQ